MRVSGPIELYDIVIVPHCCRCYRGSSRSRDAESGIKRGYLTYPLLCLIIFDINADVRTKPWVGGAWNSLERVMALACVNS